MHQETSGNHENIQQLPSIYLEEGNIIEDSEPFHRPTLIFSESMVSNPGMSCMGIRKIRVLHPPPSSYANHPPKM